MCFGKHQTSVRLISDFASDYDLHANRIISESMLNRMNKFALVFVRCESMSCRIQKSVIVTLVCITWRRSLKGFVHY